MLNYMWVQTANVVVSVEAHSLPSRFKVNCAVPNSRPTSESDSEAVLFPFSILNSLFLFEGQLCTFVWVLCLLCRYFNHLNTFLCRHALSDWQSTETYLYIIGKFNISKHFLLLPLTFKENTIPNLLQYTHYRYTYQQGS